MSPHVGHGRTQFNSQVSRDTTGNRFLIASSPTEGFFRAGFKSPKQASSYTATHYYINIVVKLLSPLTLSRPNTCLGRLFPCVHSPFFLWSWNESSMVSERDHLREAYTRCEVCTSPDLMGFFIFFCRRAWYTVPKLACKSTTLHLYMRSPYHHVCSNVENCDASLARCIVGTHSRCRLSVCVYYICLYFF